MLNTNVYNQAVVQWTVDPEITTTNVHWDLNGDGALEVAPYNNLEITAIRSNCFNGAFDLNVFLVKTCISNTFVGFTQTPTPTDPQERSIFILTDAASAPLTATKVAQAIAHEIGHAWYRMRHDETDTSNLMYPDLSAAGTSLTEAQWQKINEVP